MRLHPAGTSLPNHGRRARRARLCLTAASGIAVLLSAAACSNSVNGGGTVSNTITIAAVPGIADAPLYLARKEGLFSAAGLSNVVIKTYPTAAKALNALQNAQADIAGVDYGNIFAAQAQSGSKNLLRILADGYDAQAGVLQVLTMPGRSTNPLDLAGKKIAVPSDGVIGNTPSGEPISLDSAAAAQVLSSFLGNNVGSVQWVKMPQGQEVNALARGRANLAAILVSQPYVYQAEQQYGAVDMFDAASGFTANLPLSGYAAMNAWARANPEAVADFKSAIARAQSQASMAGPIQTVLPEAAGVPQQAADLVTVGSYPTATSVSELGRVVRLMVGFHMLPDSAVNLSNMLNGS